MHVDKAAGLQEALPFLSLPASVPYSPVTCNVPCCYKSVAAPKQSDVDVYKL